MTIHTNMSCIPAMVWTKVLELVAGSDIMTFFNSIHKKLIVRYISFIKINIRILVCLLICSFKSTITLIFIFVVTGSHGLNITQHTTITHTHTHLS